MLHVRGHAPEYVEGLYARAAAEHSLDPRALVAYANYLQFTCLGERNVPLEEEENTRVAVQAGQLYETALMLDPSHYEALHGYGLYQRNELYDNQGALTCYNLALELRPNDPILLCNMAAALSSTQPQGDSSLPDNFPLRHCYVPNTTTALRRAPLHSGANHCHSDLLGVGWGVKQTTHSLTSLCTMCFGLQMPRHWLDERSNWSLTASTPGRPSGHSWRREPEM